MNLEDAANKAKYLGDLRVKFLATLEKEHSAPAKDDSRVHVINWLPCGRAGSRLKTTKMALPVTVAVAGMTMKTQRELRLVELLLRRRSTAAREMDGTLLLRKRGISWAHGGD